MKNPVSKEIDRDFEDGSQCVVASICTYMIMHTYAQIYTHVYVYIGIK